MAFRAVGRHDLRCARDAYICGYFQNEGYFLDIADAIRRRFRLGIGLSEKSKVLVASAQVNTAVAVHVRRGDYVENEAFGAFFGACTPDYFVRACRLAEARVDARFFAFFSDDVDWVRRSLLPTLREANVKAEFVVVDWVVAPHEALLLMGMLGHNIISNSTFSWWGAWLNPDREKLVVAPTPWVLHANIANGGNSIVPDGWTKVPR